MDKINIFIAYETTTGLGLSENLKEALEKRGFEVFLASSSLRAGDKEYEKRYNELKKCKFFIIVITVITIYSNEVIKEYKKAVELDKSIIPCRYKKIKIAETGELYGLQQLNFSDKYDLASEVLIEINDRLKKDEKDISLDKDPNEYIRRGNFLFNISQLEEKFKYPEIVIGLVNDDPICWYSIVVMLYENHNYKEALKVFNKIIKLNPLDSNCYFYISKIFLFKDDKEKSLKYLKKAVELNSECKEIAKSDENFKKFWNDEEFKRIVG